MNREFENIFEECLERLQQGDTIDNCLRSYPEVAADLEILLRTSLNVNWRASRVQPRPEFKARARAEFIRAQYQQAYDKYTKHIASSKPTIFSLQRAWMPTLAVILLIIFSSVGTAAAASNAMPDQPLYPVKLASEQAQLTLTLSDQAKAELSMKFVETRTQEITTMATEGKTEQVIIATEKLEQNLMAVEQAVQRLETGKTTQTLTPKPTTTPQPATIEPPTPSPEPEPGKVEPTPPNKATTSEPTDEPGPTAAEPTPSASSESQKNTAAQTGEGKETQDQSQSTQREQKVEKLKQSLQTTISKNITLLEKAQDKTPERSRQAIQRAIELAKERQYKLNQGTTRPEGTSEQKPEEGSEKPDVNNSNENNKFPTWQKTSANIQDDKSGNATTVPVKIRTNEDVTNTRNNSGYSDKPSESSSSSVTTTSSTQR